MRPACTRDRVGDPRAVAQPVEAGSPHGADDVDDELRRAPRLPNGSSGATTSGALVAAGLREALPGEREHGEQDAPGDESGRARDAERHRPRVAANPSHVGHGPVATVRQRDADVTAGEAGA